MAKHGESDAAAGIASWSRQYGCRRAVAGRFGDIFGLPVRRRAEHVLSETLQAGASVLEVGAGSRKLCAPIESVVGRGMYRSMDIDEEGEHDFVALSQIEAQFEIVFAFEVVEHIETAELPAWLDQVSQAVAGGGRLILSTPNIFYPPAYLRDVTHRTPLCFDELGGLLESVGLQVESVVRCHQDSWLRHALRRYMFGWLFRLLRIDFAPQITIVARRPVSATRAGRAVDSGHVERNRAA